MRRTACSLAAAMLSTACATQPTVLSMAQVEKVVRAHALDVRAACWESTSNAMTGNVTVVFTVTGAGSVDRVVSSGDDPLVTSCVEQAIRAWEFPATGRPSTIQLPFHFARPEKVQ